MNLVMFDMDGTLTDSFRPEDNYYDRCIERVLGLPPINVDIGVLPHASASYCLEHVVQKHFGTTATSEQSTAVQTTIIQFMEERARRDGEAVREISGARACVESLLARGYAVAIASGDWEATARYKLARIGLRLAELPMAFCDVSHSRIEIMRTALTRAARHFGCDAFERIVYVGDGGWDVKACRELGWPLIGVGSGTPAQRLRELGVTEVIDSYEPFDRFHSALERAAPPHAVAV